MPKRSRTESSSSATTAAVVLRGGFAHPPRTIEKYREGRLCDVQLQAADGTTFAAHVLCLTAGSAYFDALYTSGSDWSDAASGTIALHAVPAHALDACLEYIYAGEAEVTNEDQLLGVLEAAAYLQMPELVEAAAVVLTARLGPNTALQTWTVADRQDLASLKTAAATAVARHFDAVAASGAWAQAPVELVRQLLASDRLAVGDETCAYHAAIGWLRAQSPPLPAEDAAALLALVRFPLMTPDFFASTVRAEPLLRTPSGMDMLMDAMSARAFGNDGTQRRIGFGQLYAVGGYTGLVGLTSVERYDPATNTWEAVAPMGAGRVALSTAVIDGKLYAVSGRSTGSTPLNTVERYDPATNTWEAVAPMGIARLYGAVCCGD